MDIATATVTIERVTSGNPFDTYTSLKSIWSADLQPHVEADTVRDLQMGDADPAHNHIYTIHADGQVVGITGFYLLDEMRAGLRWHGIIPTARANGFSRSAVDLVCQALLNAPNFERVRVLAEFVELASADAYFLLRHFDCLGFEAVGRPQDADDAPVSAALPKGSGNWQLMLRKVRHMWLGKGLLD